MTISKVALAGTCSGVTMASEAIVITEERYTPKEDL